MENPEMPYHFRNNRRGSVTVAAATLAVLSGGGATAAELDEVLVTARKVAESMQEAPVAVSVLSGDELAARSVSQLNDVQRYAPNLTFFPSGIMGESSGQVYIRGVGQFDYFVTADPGVGIYVDGVYLGRSLGNLLDIVDVERIEVLRGPQGTLYGKNTIGGAINVISSRPTDDFAGFFDIKTGSYGRLNARANLSLPIQPGVLAAKLAAGTRNASGFGDRPLVGDRMGGEGTDALQAQLRWTPGGDFEALLSADYTHVNSNLSVNHVEVFGSPPLVQLHNALAVPLRPFHTVDMGPYGDQYFSTDPYDSNGTGSNAMDIEIWGVSLVLDWTIGPVAVKSITAYRNLDQLIGIDPDGSPEPFIDETDRIDQKQLSQELQFSGQAIGERLKWVAGLYYMQEESVSDVTSFVASDLFPAFEQLPMPMIGPFGGAGNLANVTFDLDQFNYMTQDTDSYAAYAQSTFAFNDRWSGTLGMRYTRDEKDFFVQSLRMRTPVPLLPPSTQSDSWSDTSLRAGLDFQATDDVLLYLSVAEGFKSGGFNGRARNVGELEGYDPETILAYEIGMKSEWLDRRLRLNAAAFFSDYQDVQLTEQHLDETTGSQTIVTQNAGDAEIKGFELELDARPVPQLRLNAALGYVDAKYTRISAAAASTGLTLQHKLIGTPEWTASAGAEYTIPASERGEVVLRADYSYRAKTYFQLMNDESIAQPGYGLLNLRAAFNSADGAWTIATGLTNATDKVYRASGVSVLDSLGFTVGYYGRPREWFLQGTFRY
ncbi:MAG: TonB-dependent receptor [Gammaproteobacteria bacterium]|nr:MAG: TonB-dependent receptor [Gammaproteobacteria bacterium]